MIDNYLFLYLGADVSFAFPYGSNGNLHILTAGIPDTVSIGSGVESFENDLIVFMDGQHQNFDAGIFPPNFLDH
jgi:hypothetical protein